MEMENPLWRPLMGEAEKKTKSRKKIEAANLTSLRVATTRCVCLKFDLLTVHCGFHAVSVCRSRGRQLRR